MVKFDEVYNAARVANRVGVPAREFLADTGYDPSTACWLWVGATFRKGYGNMSVTRHDGVHVNMGAHRVAWMGVNGDPPDDKPYMLHGCDNARCCRPSHLRPGTQQDNLNEMRERGRTGDCRNFGEENGCAKLDEDAVRLIRSTKPYYGMQKMFAAKYGVTVASISNVTRGKTWKHVQ